jgi:Spy/CpxP family protein refolding chaperone
MKQTKATIGLLAFGFVITIAAVAFAHEGYGRHMGGYGGHMMGPGYGGGHMMGFGPGYGPHMRGYGGWGALSEEDAAKIDTAKEDFYKETRDLRGKIDDVRITLRNEMDKDQPNEDKVMKLQKQLSEMQAKFDQKSLDYELKIGKLVPEGYQSRGFRGDYCW